MNITIVNQHANNYGDESACVGVLLKLLKNTNVDEINLIYIGKGIVHFNNTKVKHNRNINVKNIGLLQIILRIVLSFFHINYRGKKILDEYLKIIEKSDYVFVSPAGADLGRYKVWSALLNLYLVNTCKKKIIFHLNTIGSSRDKIFDFMADKILKKSIIYVREDASFKYLAEKNIFSVKGVDSAFLLPNGILKQGEKKVLTFIPTQLDNWNRDYHGTDIESKIYKNVVIPVYNFAKKYDFEVCLLPHLGTDEELKFYKKIIKNFDESENMYILDDVEDVWDYQNQICNSTLVVSMRYHGVVIAAKNFVPFVSIAYENKMNEVSGYVGMNSQNVNVLDVEADELYEMIYQTYINHDTIVQKLISNVECVRKSAERPIEENVK